MAGIYFVALIGLPELMYHIRKIFFLCVLGMLCPMEGVWAQSCDFNVSAQSGCAPFTINFYDQSTPTPSAWSWDFGDGNSSTSKDPSNTYYTSGVYDITLTVTFPGNQVVTTTKQAYISIHSKPTANFTNSATTGCEDWPVSFTNQSTQGSSPIVSNFWDFGNTFSDTAKNPTHVFRTPGTFDVKLIVEDVNGCQAIREKKALITVLQIPDAQFASGSQVGCSAPHTVSFVNTTVANASGGVTYAWTFGNGNTSTTKSPSTTYTAGGSYDVRLIATNSNGCKDTMLKPAFINVEIAKASFTSSPNTGCTPLTVNFTNTSTPNLAGNQYSWSFGSVAYSSAKDTAVEFNGSGNYSVKMVFVTPNGCRDSVIKTNLIQAQPGPTSLFYANDSNACRAPFEVQFTSANTSTATYEWDFGDGTTSTLKNPKKKYLDTGKYDVVLKVTGSNGCVSYRVGYEMIRINKPRADFTPSILEGCAPLKVGFSNNTLTYSPLSSVLYKFGDGTTSNLPFPNHTYNDTGLYLPKIIITTNDGCIDSATYDTIGVGMKPVANFMVDSTEGCRNQLMVKFTSLTNMGVIKADRFEWLTGTGLKLRGEEVSFVYSSFSQYYDVTHIALHHGCPDTMVKMDLIQVLNPSSKFVTKSGGCNDDSLFFENQSIGGHWYKWLFGDGDSLVSDTFGDASHVYGPGTFEAKLVAYDSLTGCWDTSKTNFNVASSDVLKFRSDTAGCTRAPLWFFDQTIGSSDWTWTIGESLACTTRNCQFYPEEPGWYDVKYSAIVLGCRYTSVKQQYLHVYGPKFDFITSDIPICAPQLVNVQTHIGGERPLQNAKVQIFEDKKLIETITGIGDTIPYYFARPTIPQDSVYAFYYSASDTSGCYNYAIDTFRVYRPDVQFVHERRATCDGDLNYFEASIIDSTAKFPLRYQWEFGDGTIESYDTMSVFHTYQNDSLYDMRLIAFDSVGCSDTVFKTLDIDVRNVKADFAVSDTFKLCPPLVAKFYDSSVNSYNGIVEWKWSLGEGNIGFAPQPVKAYLEPGIFDVSLRVTDSLGCVDSITKPAYIEIKGTKITYEIDTNYGCTPLQIHVTSTALGTAEINWNMRDGSAIIDSSDFYYTYHTNGEYVPSAFVKDNSGCQYVVAAKDTIRVQATPDPIFSVPPACIGNTSQPKNLSNDYGDTVSYTWYFTASDSIEAFEPDYTYPGEGDYTVMLFARSTLGCQDSSSAIALVSDPIGDLVISDERTCATDTTEIELINLGVGKIVQVNWFFDDGNSFSGTDSSTKHVYLNKGIYRPYLNFKNEYGCTGSVPPLDSLVVGDNFPPVVSSIYRTSVEDNNHTSLWYASNNSIDFEKYIIQRWMPNGRFDSIAEFTNRNDTQFTDKVPTLHSQYTYRVITKNFCGYYTDTNALSPHRTIELFAEPASDASKLTWTPYLGWTPVKYEIWRLNPGVGFEKIKEVSGTELQALDSMISCNQGYYYRVKAIGANPHQESFSDSSGAIPNYIPYVAPNELYSASIEGPARNLISWNFAQGGKEPVAWYIVERSRDGVNYKETGRFDEFTNYTMDKVDSASLRPFYYRTIVEDSCGYQSEPSNYGRTMILKAEMDTNDRPKLSWMPYEYWEEGVDFYDIEIYDNNQFVYLASTDGFTTTYTDLITNVNERANYCYRITARSLEDGGKISHSSIACAPVSSRIYVPNAFRPFGGLKENSHFYPKGMYISEFHMQIYDRWGKLVFETNKMEEGWDGTIEGEPAPFGVYIYSIEYKGVDKDFERLRGNVTLVR